MYVLNFRVLLVSHLTFKKSKQGQFALYLKQETRKQIHINEYSHYQGVQFFLQTNLSTSLTKNILYLILVELKGGIKNILYHASSDRMPFFIICLVFTPEADFGACNCLKTVFFKSCWKSNLGRQERRKAISV